MTTTQVYLVKGGKELAVRSLDREGDSDRVTGLKKPDVTVSRNSEGTSATPGRVKVGIDPGCLSFDGEQATREGV